MLYIDFDGVILDTENLLFKEWRKRPNHRSLPESEKIKYMQGSDWEYILNNSEIINDSIYYLKNMNPKETFILTKIHSLEEGTSKIKWVRKQNIEQSVILVPYYLKKTDMVDARGNILVDDCLYNLSDWESNKGKPIFFDYDDDNFDSWHQENVQGYQKIKKLSIYREDM